MRDVHDVAIPLLKVSLVESVANHGNCRMITAGGDVYTCGWVDGHASSRREEEFAQLAFGQGHAPRLATRLHTYSYSIREHAPEIFKIQHVLRWARLSVRVSPLSVYSEQRPVLWRNSQEQYFGQCCPCLAVP